MEPQPETKRPERWIQEAHGWNTPLPRSAAQKVSGDFYDFIPLGDDRWGIVIGDVSGKGVASALYMDRLTSDFRVLAICERNPSRMMERINDLLCERSRQGMFVTLLYMILAPRKRSFTTVNAGHIPPVLWNGQTGRFVSLDSTGGPPAGIVPGQCYPADTFHLAAGDCVFLSTDGLMEAKNPKDERFGEHRLEAAIRSGDSDGRGVYGRVMESLRDFVQETPPVDDMTLVLLSVEKS